MNKTIPLTGASGFIGSAFLKNMLASGFRIRALTRDSSRNALHDRLEWYQADLLIEDDWGKALLGVAETGWILPPNDPKALAGAIVQAIHDKQNNHDVWLERKLACRNRVLENFSLDTMIEKYKQVWST